MIVPPSAHGLLLHFWGKLRLLSQPETCLHPKIEVHGCATGLTRHFVSMEHNEHLSVTYELDLMGSQHRSKML